jgi:DNA end-binding protein Ku
MALRPSWDGFLRLGMISVPVKAYSATSGTGSQIGFHQIHAKCGNRIRYRKVCPVHGEVTNEEIVPGYEVTKGEYVLLDPKELRELKADPERSVSIDTFVAPGALDPVYFADRTYYLTPDGRAGEKPYAVLHRVMARAGRWGVGTMLLSGREHAVVVRPLGRLLAAGLLHFHDEVKQPGPFEAEVPEAEVSAEELRLAQALLDASTAPEFDFSAYKDQYAGKVMKLIESRAGARRRKGSAARKGEEPPAIINLMDALRQSLTNAKAGNRGGRAGRASRRARAPKRKTG